MVSRTTGGWLTPCRAPPNLRTSVRYRFSGPTAALLGLVLAVATETPARTAPASTRGGGGSSPTQAAIPHAIVPDGAPPPIMKLADIKPGMKGHALTVFRGTKP